MALPKNDIRLRCIVCKSPDIWAHFQDKPLCQSHYGNYRTKEKDRLVKQLVLELKEIASKKAYIASDININLINEIANLYRDLKPRKIPEKPLRRSLLDNSDLPVNRQVAALEQKIEHLTRLIQNKK